MNALLSMTTGSLLYNGASLRKASGAPCIQKANMATEEYGAGRAPVFITTYWPVIPAAIRVSVVPAIHMNRQRRSLILPTTSSLIGGITAYMQEKEEVTT